jgi:hypothetical protein
MEQIGQYHDRIRLWLPPTVRRVFDAGESTWWASPVCHNFAK